MKVNIDNIQINYKLYGENNTQPVVVLHGWGTNLESFDLVSRYLAINYKVYALDLPGFGQSTIPNKALSINDYAKIIYRFLNALDIAKPILIGHSFGGRIIITLTGSLRYEASKIILINSAGIRPKRGIRYYLKIYTYKILKYIIKYFKEEKRIKYLNKLRTIFGSSDYNNVDEVMKRTLSLVVNTDLKKYMKNITAPTLLVWGDNDTITPISDAITMQHLIPDSGLVILKDAGHYAYLDKYFEFKLILLYFLQLEI